MDYFGLSATLAQLEARVTRLLAEAPAMTPQQAAKIAIKESEGGGAGKAGKVDEPIPAKGRPKDAEPTEAEVQAAESPSKLTADEIAGGVRMAKNAARRRPAEAARVTAG